MKTQILSLALAGLSIQAMACGIPNTGLVAHEWGTFTSVQGADGAQMRWNPFTVSELPAFVHTASRPTASAPRDAAVFLGKISMMAFQRMETPVIYFYSQQEQTVSARVDFPDGIMTEWYPEAAAFGSGGWRAAGKEAADQKSFLEWRNLHVLSKADSRARENSLLLDKSGSHYFAAREAEANLLASPATKGSPAGGELEKFLFYRGVADFQAPLAVTQNSNGEGVTLRNTGREELRGLYVLAVHDGEGKFVFVPSLAPQASEDVPFNAKTNMKPLAALREQIALAMSVSLVGEGLFPKEAGAMVRTWQDSWFAEEGVRVLYALPRAWTDRTLPLKLDPAPKSTARVMVGRAELITPETEWKLLRQVVRFNTGDTTAREAAVRETRALGLGRFAEPTMRRVLGTHPALDFSRSGWELVAAAQKADARSKPLVSR